MEGLNARIQALERRLERAEEALRDGGAGGLRLPSVPVTFEDVAVQFSHQEWALLDHGQKELYRSVMRGSYEMLVSLYCDLAKPELLSRIEKEEEPCVSPEPQRDGEAVPPEPAAEPGSPGSVSDGAVQEEAKESREGSRSPVATPDRSTPRVLHEAVGTPMELSSPGPSAPCPISTCCRDVVNLRPPPSPPPAAGADVGIPTEIPREEVAAEELAVPERPLEGLQKEELKDAASGGQDLVAAVPKELDREPIPGLCRAAACTDRSHPVALPRKTGGGERLQGQDGELPAQLLPAEVLQVRRVREEFPAQNQPHHPPAEPQQLGALRLRRLQPGLHVQEENQAAPTDPGGHGVLPPLRRQGARRQTPLPGRPAPCPGQRRRGGGAVGEAQPQPVPAVAPENHVHVQRVHGELLQPELPDAAPGDARRPAPLHPLRLLQQELCLGLRAVPPGRAALLVRGVPESLQAARAPSRAPKNPLQEGEPLRVQEQAASARGTYLGTGGVKEET
nr:uncharacterized protein LOC113842973 isoform X2 [Anas platyrhynchos]